MEDVDAVVEDAEEGEAEAMPRADTQQPQRTQQSIPQKLEIQNTGQAEEQDQRNADSKLNNRSVSTLIVLCKPHINKSRLRVSDALCKKDRSHVDRSSVHAASIVDYAHQKHFFLMSVLPYDISITTRTTTDTRGQITG